MAIEFNYEGKSYKGELESEFFLEEQKWQKVNVEGINWLVPQGWPNNATAICEEEHPQEYAFLCLAHEELLIDPPPLPVGVRRAGALKCGAELKGKPALPRHWRKHMKSDSMLINALVDDILRNGAISAWYARLVYGRHAVAVMRADERFLEIGDYFKLTVK